MRFYETIYIVKPDVTDEVLAERDQWVQGILTRQGAQVVNVEPWGKKRLAYQVKKHRYGYYFLLHYEGEPEVVPELERNLRMSEDILKYITVRLEGQQIDKARAAAVRAAEEAVRREQEAASKPEPTEAAAPEETAEGASETDDEETVASDLKE